MFGNRRGKNKINQTLVPSNSAFKTFWHLWPGAISCTSLAGYHGTRSVEHVLTPPTYLPLPHEQWPAAKPSTMLDFYTKFTRYSPKYGNYYLWGRKNFHRFMYVFLKPTITKILWKSSTAKSYRSTSLFILVPFWIEYTYTHARTALVIPVHPITKSVVVIFQTVTQIFFKKLDVRENLIAKFGTGWWGHLVVLGEWEFVTSTLVSHVSNIFGTISCC